MWRAYLWAAVERKPRTLCGCQSVFCMISARVAPFGRPIRSRIVAPLLWARGALTGWVGANWAGCLAEGAAFCGAAALALPRLWALWLCGVSCLGWAPF